MPALRPAPFPLLCERVFADPPCQACLSLLWPFLSPCLVFCPQSDLSQPPWPWPCQWAELDKAILEAVVFPAVLSESCCLAGRVLSERPCQASLPELFQDRDCWFCQQAAALESFEAGLASS